MDGYVEHKLPPGYKCFVPVRCQMKTKAAAAAATQLRKQNAGRTSAEITTTDTRARLLDMDSSNEPSPDSSSTPDQSGRSSSHTDKGGQDANRKPANCPFSNSPASSHHGLRTNHPDGSQGGRVPNFLEGSDTEQRQGRAQADFTTVMADVWGESLCSHSGFPMGDATFGSFLYMDPIDITRWDPAG